MRIRRCRRVSKEIQREIGTLYTQGFTMNAIRKKINLSYGAVWACLDSHGIKRREPSYYTKRVFREKEISRIKNGYLSGISLLQLSKEIHAGIKTVKRFLKSEGILSRTRKLNLPEKEIIKVYLSGMPLKEISKKFNRKTSGSIIRILKWNRIKLRSQPEREKTRKLFEKRAEIIKLYKNGWATPKIGKRFNLSYKLIWKLLKKNNIMCRKRKYFLDEDAFKKIDSEGKAWLLGWIMTDAGLEKGSLRIGLSKKENTQIFLFFKDVLASNALLKNAPRYNYIYFLSQKLIADLENLGVACHKENRSIDKLLSKIPPSLIRHFWRGMIEGDGTISFRDRHLNVSLLSADEKYIKKFQEFLSSSLSINLPIHANHKNRKKAIYACRISGRERALKISKFLYEDSTCYLKRKRDNYLAGAKFFSDSGRKNLEWLPSEIEKLKAFAANEKRPYSELSKELGRGKTSAQNRARTLGLRKTRRSYFKEGKPQRC